MKYIKNTCACLLVVFSSQLAIAQEQTTGPAALEMLSQRSLWKKTSNPAGLQFDQPFQYSTLSVGYELYDGNFRRPQQGGSGNRQTVHTEGNYRIKDYYLSGSFDYRRDQIKDANYNASIIDPFRGMPYIIADLNPSDWNNQHYEMQFNIASPAYNDQFSFGFAGSYKVSSGAKQRDIRSENYFYNLSLSPGVVYTPSEKHHLGLNFVYSNVKEESYGSNVNNSVDQQYYELLGLGTAVNYLGGGRSNNYIGDALGGGFQYQYAGNVNVLLSADYSVEAEDLQVSFEVPRDGASVLRHIWKAKLAFIKEGTQTSHFLDFNYCNRNMDGIQYVTQRDNSSSQMGWQTLFKSVRSTYSTEQAGVQYHLTSNKGNAYSWKLSAGAVYEKLNDEYLLPNSVKQAENVLFNAGIKKNLALADKKSKQLLVGLDLGYNANISGVYNYGGAHADYPTVTGLEQNDFRYLTSSYASIGVPLVYSQKIKNDSQNMLFIKAQIQAQFTNSYQFNDRIFAGFNVGVNF
ncbi:DUF6850 family outer membrane beta-barrel protein [Pedobacter metabolipauper]|nr:DUF6850 family outer membrane beta-barrel protein [Pedobacter metabolipauper]